MVKMLLVLKKQSVMNCGPFVTTLSRKCSTFRMIDSVTFLSCIGYILSVLTPINDKTTVGNK